MIKQISLAFLISLVVACGSGSGGGSNNQSPAANPVVTPPPAVVPPVVVEPPVVEPPVVVVPPVVTPPPVVVVPPVVEPVQMLKPTECLTDASGTNVGGYEFLTCDGVLVHSDIDFPYDPSSKEIAIIDLLAVVDTKLDEELDGGTYEEFAQREVDLANKLFADSGVYVMLRLVDVKTVEVAKGDLRDQIKTFANGRNEFSDLNDWQEDAGADLAFLFKKIEDEPFACGVAYYNDETKIYSARRGVSQCHINTVFQETETTRYYERAHETFTHEIGHILGLDHNIESAGVLSKKTLFPFSYGYLVRGYDSGAGSREYNGYGTIMSYSDLPTGRFSTPIYSERFLIPENGTSQRLGKERNGFDIFGKEKNPETNSVDALNRVRYYMSQLHEQFNANGERPRFFSPNLVDDDEEDIICIF